MTPFSVGGEKATWLLHPRISAPAPTHHIANQNVEQI
jgi:hypothetical protein